jgi:hypothetical protein
MWCVARRTSTRLGAGMGGWRRVIASWTGLQWCDHIISLSSSVFNKLWIIYFRVKELCCNNGPYGDLILICKALWTLLRGSFNVYVRSSLSSDLPGVDLATLNRMILYYRLMTKWNGLGDSTELSRVGLSHLSPCLVQRHSSPWIHF